MGLSQSTAGGSVGRYKNDYELVIRAAKELEQLLEGSFGAPCGKNVFLHDKISSARNPANSSELPEPLIRKLRYVATIRNALVHDSATVRLENRPRFVANFDEATTELHGILHEARAKPRSACAIS
ncbi:hypothetical protein M885DRAFT_511036 [Pelagophyceae sp. CCMP2097]|nr:hypothetical protein M885DRAFT_511036 [Pelagophyceae sp. CCMP2097]|mmetsp:Transcript_13956/g.46582  ORF Transcript_13956/g.46582 Transcript_13956/m.46582 type:complete len:126 (+) Transcript_13956:150-527(+)|eukprot:CAMPEP_0184111150 /NCGR_PEP_ID=MMETSP0974-20121125/17763_1 /TAXON_ID=483370 /ORGANISM="non described non described, Strain CCMP2097" /LENGTH=125 /DNA_ID=CAMNT_0026414227 /DNA_START=153 /DNA_END=530 /DNA_ORIENTATION=-